ncbi:MAG: alpha/beta hydrolase [Rhodobacteraceae bacterium]|nr:alpha/beta hydrolase [Paracoccaceae bacterium]
MPAFYTTPQARRLAYHKTAGASPNLVFLGGFKSDMQGSKALFLESWAQQRGFSYLRFDYSGHGESSGVFTDGSIGNWAQDAEAIISEKTQGPIVLVGSSMGGWIALLLAQRLAGRVAGLMTIAAAPDFTEDSMWPSFSAEQKAEVLEKGLTLLPSEYGEAYPITRQLIEEARDHLVMRASLSLPFPVICLQGTQDRSVTRQTALNLLEHIESPDVSLTFLAGQDHSFSTAECLAVIDQNLRVLFEKSTKHMGQP